MTFGAFGCGAAAETLSRITKIQVTLFTRTQEHQKVQVTFFANMMTSI